MPQYVKCQYCKESVLASQKDTLACEVKVSESTGRAKNQYYHHECYPKHLEAEEFKANELREKNELNEVIKSLYGVQYQLPFQFWQLVADLREGTNRYEKFWKKKHKEGITYSLLKEAYLLARDNITWSRLNKQFKTLEEELRWGLKSAVSKVNDANRRMKGMDQQAKRAIAMEKAQLEMMKDDREVSYKKKQHEDDISFLLGND